VSARGPRGLALALGLLLVGGIALPARAAEPAVPPIALPRTWQPVTIDGDLGEPAWKDAAAITQFWDITFGDNRAPLVETRAFVMYDTKALYVAVVCDDPEPAKIRAPYVDRDGVFAAQDNVAVFVDTRNDRQAAFEFRVNPRGIQGDAIYHDASQEEDFTPDFYYDTAARITDRGWQVEMRIPFSTLRYPRADPQSWGIRIWRNYPRGFRHGLFSSPFPAGSNCFVCHLHELSGISGLPSSQHFVIAPYVSGQSVAEAPAVGEPLGEGDEDADAGVDVKWTPGAATALDATINPDFSQIEADVAQIAVNSRFALFFPEKRPFFLEGVDLLKTPIQAVYTRTITSPRWGGRVTGKAGKTSYTLLTAQDRGGGSVVVPGPTESSLAPQDYRSFVGVGRVRQDFGTSFVGLLYTGRVIDSDDGGGYNHVFGPDVQWRPNERDKVAGQFLLSRTETPDRPDLLPEWDGRRLSSRALVASWLRQTRTVDTFVRYRDFGEFFRADEGFVPQVGYRDGFLDAGYTFYREDFFTALRPYVVAEYAQDREQQEIHERVEPGIVFQGRKNLQGFAGLAVEKLSTNGVLLPVTRASFRVQLDPGRLFPLLSLSGFVGEDVDVVGTRVGTGADLLLGSTLRPTDHLTLEAVSELSWLNVDDTDLGSGRLFTAQVQRLKATYNFTSRLFVRLIGQYVETRRDTALYPSPVVAREASFSGSALLSYRINWQTAFFLGYGDDRERPEGGGLPPTSRQFFVKLSYAFQR
jgi:Domain of unknown function (DUF5916)/Carbohydrate family 9 binding domain-like